MNDGVSPEDRWRLRRCRWAAFLAPVVAASASFAVVRVAFFMGGPRFRATPAYDAFWPIYEYGVFPGNAFLGAVAAAVVVLFLHPALGRRWRAAALWTALAPVIYVAAFVGWEQLWQLTR